MNLVVDIGNSFIKVALVDGGNVISTQRLTFDEGVDVEFTDGKKPGAHCKIIFLYGSH